MSIANSLTPSNQNPLEAKLHVILLMTGKEVGTKHYFQFIVVTKNNSEAAMKAIEYIKRKLPDLWDIGMKSGGFKVVNHNSFSENILLKMFRREEHPEQTIEIIEAIEPADEEKNRMLKMIISTNDLEYLKKMKANLTDYEYKYIKEKIKYAAKSTNANG